MKQNKQMINLVSKFEKRHIDLKRVNGKINQLKPIRVLIERLDHINGLGTSI